MASSTLFPPSIQSVQPTFDVDQGIAKVYFSLSSFNSISDIKQVQISIRYQTNNLNALITSIWPQKIMTSEIKESTESGFPPYYIEINGDNLTRQVQTNDVVGFLENEILKVQIRFSSDDIDVTNLSELNDHLNSFSEWSTVTLLRGIKAPSFSIPILENNGTTALIQVGNASFIGSYNIKTRGETLKAYQMLLYSSNNELLADSGIIRYNTANQVIYNDTESETSIAFECDLNYLLTDSSTYILVCNIESKNGYRLSKTYTFQTSSFIEKTINAYIEPEMLVDEGCINIKLISKDGTIAHTGIILIRTDASSNFTHWKDLASVTFANSPINWEYRDYTAESGMYYVYGVQTVDNYGHRGQLLQTDKIILEYEDAFLYEKGKQLKLKYNFVISSYATKVYEQVIDTIEDKYSHIIRNGNVYYKTFQCSGIISSYMDEEHLFTTDNEILNNQAARWDGYRENKKILETYDYTKERGFRQKVEDFLYNGNVKLFKSLTEGNIIVKLDASSISLTPKTELGRLLYEFSATAYEIAAPTIENFIAFGFIDNPAVSLTKINFNDIKLGRINGYDTTITKNTNILNLIREKYNVGTAHNGVKIEDFTLNYLRLEFDSDPYPIDLSQTPQPASSSSGKNIILGHLIQFGSNTIVIPYPNNIYEFKDENVEITSNQRIFTVKDEVMNIDFVISLQENEDLSGTATTSLYSRVNGQLWNTFYPEDDIYNLIFSKYFVEKEKYYINLSAVFTVNVEANPGTIFRVKYTNDEEQTLTIGETGELFIDPIDRTVGISSLIFEEKTDAIINYFIQIVKGIY